jgi:hypothetical protein
MSTLSNPVGPEDKRVYLRRRLLVLAGLIAVIVAIVLVIVKPGSSGGVSSAESVQLPAGLAEQVEKPAEGTSSAEAPPACADGSLLVEAVTDENSYAADQLPKLSLMVTNRGDTECTVDVGSVGMRFDVSSGAEKYWNSDDCLKKPASLPVIMAPAETLETEPIIWERTRSAPDTCEIERDAVPGGGASYHLFVEVAGVRSDSSAQFILQ